MKRKAKQSRKANEQASENNSVRNVDLSGEIVSDDENRAVNIVSNNNQNLIMVMPNDVING